MWQAPDFVDTCQFHKVLPFELRRLSIDLPKGGGAPVAGRPDTYFKNEHYPPPLSPTAHPAPG